MKYLFFLLVFCSVLISSCSKENLKEEIIGRWILDTITTTCDSGQNTEIQEADSNGCLLIDNIPTCSVLVFEENGTGLLISAQFSLPDTTTITYATFGGDNLVEICFSGGCSDYFLENDMLSLTTPITTPEPNNCEARIVYIKG